MTAWPVPSGSSWTATSTPSNAPAEPGEVTTTSGSGSSSRAASATQSTSRRPSSGWRCFGVSERIRVPRPPARTTAATPDEVTDVIQMAGAPGFEPGITGPKPVALPLGYAPKAGEVPTPRILTPVAEEHEEGDDREERLRNGCDPRGVSGERRPEPGADREVADDHEDGDEQGAPAAD